MIEISLGQRIHELRDKADLSLRGLAKRIGISSPFNHAEDDNGSGREPATEMLLGEQPAPDNSANQSTDFPHRSDLANCGNGHRQQNEDI